MLEAIKTFSRGRLQTTVTEEKTIKDFLELGTENDEAPDDASWTKTEAGWKMVTDDVYLSAPIHECHGQCYGFEKERDAWIKPKLTFFSAAEARPGYNTRSASEYHDVDAVLLEKVRHLARMIKSSKKTVVYAGAGLSTAAGISDYATSRRGQPDIEGQHEAKAKTYRSPMCAQPTLSHRVLVGLQRAGYLQRIIQQNHDGLPQKAGMPQHVVNEIHGALHSPDNPVVPMSGSLREDLFADLLDCEITSDLTIAVGTSLCGMNADRVVSTPAAKAPRRAIGSVVIGLQRTALDEIATLRIFATCDETFALLAELLALDDVPAANPEGTFFSPPVLQNAKEKKQYLLSGLRYDSMGSALGREINPRLLKLDLRPGAKLVIPTGVYKGASGYVDGYDREGNPRCLFRINLKKDGSVKAPRTLVLGTWWLQAAYDGLVTQLPVVNFPDADRNSPASRKLRALVDAY
ncbi:hypothetical protein AB1Y20_023335 [Prymnesium parvum]|uniref:Deacetylase sirtuin-type domain-containing protein n=1 Tax=Prymnesium parvum TaxID=97485 RepID=A0AB34JDJ5_PRYPA